MGVCESSSARVPAMHYKMWPGRRSYAVAASCTRRLRACCAAPASIAGWGIAPRPPGKALSSLFRRRLGSRMLLSPLIRRPRACARNPLVVTHPDTRTQAADTHKSQQPLPSADASISAYRRHGRAAPRPAPRAARREPTRAAAPRLAPRRRGRAHRRGLACGRRAPGPEATRAAAGAAGAGGGGAGVVGGPHRDSSGSSRPNPPRGAPGVYGPLAGGSDHQHR
jgi:hypothetical protein